MTWIEVVGWLVIGVAIVLSLTAYLLSMCLMAYCAWVGWRVMVRTELTPSKVRAMKVATMSMSEVGSWPHSITSDDIAAAIEFGQKATLSSQKIGEA